MAKPVQSKLIKNPSPAVARAAEVAAKSKKAIMVTIEDGERMLNVNARALELRAKLNANQLKFADYVSIDGHTASQAYRLAYGDKSSVHALSSVMKSHPVVKELIEIQREAVYSEQILSTHERRVFLARVVRLEADRIETDESGTLNPEYVDLLQWEKTSTPEGPIVKIRNLDKLAAASLDAKLSGDLAIASKPLNQQVDIRVTLEHLLSNVRPSILPPGKAIEVHGEVIDDD